jgi:hypothetical protein
LADSLGKPTALIVLAVVVIVVVCVSKTQVDPDLWGHVRFGGDIVSAGEVIRHDPYSFTSDREWVNHEWLAEVIMFGAYSTLGQAGLVGLKVALVLGTLGLAIGLFSGFPSRPIFTCLALLFVCVAVASTVATVRPQIFSLFLFTVLLRMLRSADRGSRWSLVVVPPLMALWVNLHGGWLVGMGALGVWIAFFVFAGRRRASDVRFALVVGALAIGATLANPYGLGMWKFLWSTVGLSRPDISEWQPVYRVPFDLVVWSAAVCFGGILLLEDRRAARFAYVVIVALMALLSFKVGRLTAFFALSVLSLGRFEHPARPFSRQDRPSGAGKMRVALVTLTAGLPIVLVGFLEVSRDASCIHMDTPRSWVVPDGDAARYVVAAGLEGRMVTFFDWGEYAIWHFAPRLRVSMDGRRETVYSQSLTDSHAELYAGTAAGLEFLETLDADYVWLPTAVPAVQVLERRGWTPLFKGRASVVFGRMPHHSQAASLFAAGPSCFPGP